ncbi:U-box domain-containing protein 33-like [Musa acuminata AAA Group]|uniref:U-box domain-containing protein 33-like n=1 Tax=Musa acuminata AAA Group TaxID=214697 RepID=UPI0031D3BA42
MEASQGGVFGCTGSSPSMESVRVGNEIEEESVETPVESEEDKVYVAVAAELEAGLTTLLWAIKNKHGAKAVVIVHVHSPTQMIPMMGGSFLASSLSAVQVSAYRQMERDKMNKRLDEYLAVCLRLKVRAEKLVIENDDVTRGLVELIAQFGITKLVMGAAADKRYSKKMKELKSKTATGVNQQADPSCMIWFVCKGKLIYTREASLHASWAENSPSKTPNQDRRLSKPGSSTNPCEEISSHSQRSDNLSVSNTDKEVSNSWSVSLPSDGESEAGSVSLSPVHDSEDLQFSYLHHELEDSDSHSDLFNKLQAVLKEVENLKREAFEESCKYRKAETQLMLSQQKAKASENLYAKEVRYRKEIEEALDREKLEVEKLKNQHAAVLKQLQNAIDENLELGHKLTESICTTRDFEEKISANCHLLHSLQEKCDTLQRERDGAVKEVEELRHKAVWTNAGISWPLILEFSYLELEQATQNFNNSLMIGKGGFGKVYKGFLRNTTVAIKMLHPKSLQGQNEFNQEVAVLSKVRHPNLVTLIGACSDVLALIYEFLPNGSLEDCLACINSTPPLTWQVRTRIIGEICSALIFLHSNKPHAVVHGDLKPDNILLDSNLVSKLGDFGICRFLIESNTSATPYHKTHPKGTIAYIDPEFLATGELTPQSDVYAFGIIILRLLTGKPAPGIAREVQKALDDGYLHAMVDQSAGNWPFVQAKQLAHLGLRCSDTSRRNRPDLVAEIWRVVEPMMKAASLSVSSVSYNSFSEENYQIPSYFICPIFQEVMSDPLIAADGFTYEAEAIKGWIDSGHETSPMTNLQLPNCELIPNRTLRSAIQEWLQLQQRS